MYGGLTMVIWFEYLRLHKFIVWKKLITGGIILPIFMSGCIELLQASCTDNRSGDWLDFLANSLGVGLALPVNYYILRPIYNPQIEMFARFKTKSSFHKTKRII